MNLQTNYKFPVTSFSFYQVFHQKFRSNIKDGPWKIFVDHYFPKDENNKGPFETYAPESVGIILLVNTVSNKLLFSYCFSLVKIYAMNLDQILNFVFKDIKILTLILIFIFIIAVVFGKNLQLDY